jgi:hypothetical protein
MTPACPVSCPSHGCGQPELSTQKRWRLKCLSTQKRWRFHAETVAILYRSCISSISNTCIQSGALRGQPCGLTTASTAPTTCPCPFGAPPRGLFFPESRNPLMRNIASIVLCLVFLAGCDNSNSLDGQIEKCVQANIKAYGPYATDKDRDLQESRARMGCLQVAGGRRN